MPFYGNLYFLFLDRFGVTMTSSQLQKVGIFVDVKRLKKISFSMLAFTV